MLFFRGCPLWSHLRYSIHLLLERKNEEEILSIRCRKSDIRALFHVTVCPNLSLSLYSSGTTRVQNINNREKIRQPCYCLVLIYRKYKLLNIQILPHTLLRSRQRCTYEYNLIKMISSVVTGFQNASRFKIRSWNLFGPIRTWKNTL
jgi:hypothetical protein